jgi:hypothetical protein
MTDDNEKAIVKAEPSAVEPIKPVEAIQVKKPGEDLELVVSGMVPGAGQIELTEKQIGILYAPIEEDIVEIRPEGLVYLPWMEYVTRLRMAFGMNWAIIPKGEPRMGPNRSSILWGFYLVVQGKLAGYAIGEQEYKINNPLMNWSDACEGAKSNALMRLCKGIGIGLELWKPSFIRKWKEAHAETYFDTKKGKDLWRRKGSVPSFSDPTTITHPGPSAEDMEKTKDAITTTNAPEENSFFSEPGGDLTDPKVNVFEAATQKPEQGSFFTDDEIQVEEKAVKQIISKSAPQPMKATPIYDEGTREGIINAIKEGLKAEKIDDSEFRAWLDIYQMTTRPTRHFVGKQFGTVRLHMGDGGDLSFLYNHLGDAIKKFRSYKKSLEVA